MKRLTSEDVRGKFAKEGYVIPEDWEYVNCSTRIPFVCPRGHEHSIVWNSWNSGSRCFSCGNNIPSSEDVRASFASEGYTLPEDWEYVNNRTKIPYICDKGHEHSITGNSWNSGQRCFSCGNNIPSSEDVRAKFAKEGYTLPEDWEYVNCKTNIPYECSNGHEHKITLNNWNSGKRCLWCGTNAPISMEDVRASFASEGYTLPEDWEYVNAQTRITYICSNGHEHSITWANWNSGSRCLWCSHNAPISTEQVRAEFTKEGYVISKDWEYVNNCSKIPYICDKGHEHSILWGNWSKGQRCFWCGRAKGNLKKFGYRKLYLYWVRIYDWINGKWCYKFGITGNSNIEGRFNRASKKWGFKYEILERTTQSSREQICQWEIDLLYEVRNYCAEWVPPEFGGCTECFESSEAFARNIWNKVTLGW